MGGANEKNEKEKDLAPSTEKEEQRILREPRFGQRTGAVQSVWRKKQSPIGKSLNRARFICVVQ